MTGQVTATTLHIPEPAVTDLRDRLARTRFPDQAPGPAWSYGTDLDYLRQLVGYWHAGFDWRAQEARLNVFPQHRTTLCDIDLHFLHVPGKGPAPCPLLLLHGWPGSVFEFLDIIPRLTDPARFGGDPADAFTVVAPSLPGYGLSFKPGQARFGVEEIADCVAALMRSSEAVLWIPAGASQLNQTNGLRWLTAITARIETKRLFRELANSPRLAPAGPPGQQCRPAMLDTPTLQDAIRLARRLPEPDRLRRLEAARQRLRVGEDIGVVTQFEFGARPDDTAVCSACTAMAATRPVNTVPDKPIIMAKKRDRGSRGTKSP